MPIASSHRNAQSGTWVRVAELQAGPNWGSHYIPRIGDEVWVEFIEGDIDRLVIVAIMFAIRHIYGRVSAFCRCQNRIHVHLAGSLHDQDRARWTRTLALRTTAQCSEADKPLLGLPFFWWSAALFTLIIFLLIRTLLIKSK